MTAAVALLMMIWSRLLQIVPSRIPPPAGAPADSLSFGDMLKRAEILAKTELVPKPLQGNPEAIVVVGVWGAEHGVPMMTAIQEVHVIENRPSPSAQLRLALIRRAGHEVRFVESDATKAVLRARRAENRRDPEAWVTVTYSLDEARKAELLDQWVERWMVPPGGKYNKKYTWKVGDDLGPADLTGAPEWVHEEMTAGRVSSKDNWRKYPADMLRARAASVMARMEFSDVMAALSVHDHTPEELGVDLGQDLDDPAAAPGGPQIPLEEDDDAREEVEDAVVLEDLGRGPETDPTRPTTGSPAPTEEPSPTPPAGGGQGHPVPRPGPGERQDQADLRYRLWALVPEDDKADVRAWLDKCDLDPDQPSDLSTARVAAVDAELDRRGYPRVRPAAADDVPPPPRRPTGAAG